MHFYLLILKKKKNIANFMLPPGCEGLDHAETSSFLLDSARTEGIMWVNVGDCTKINCTWS